MTFVGLLSGFNTPWCQSINGADRSTPSNISDTPQRNQQAFIRSTDSENTHRAIWLLSRKVKTCIDTCASLPSSKMLSQRENWMAFSLLSSMIAASSAPLTAVNSNTPSRCIRIFSASFSFSFKEQVGPSREVKMTQQ